MADTERLRITLSRSGHRFPPVETSTDPTDIDELQRQLVELARELDGRRGHLFPWQHEYTLHVEHLDRPWIPDFDMQGRDLD